MTRMRVVPWLRVVSAECNAQFIPDKIKERKKNSETSSLAFLCYTLAQLKKGIYRNSKIRDEVHADTAFLLMLLNKIELELILLLRMDCFGRLNPELGIKRIFELLICIMWCKTKWVHKFYTSRKCL